MKFKSTILRAPYKLFATLAVISTASASYYLYSLGFHILLAYLVSVNLTTFLFYSYDKWVAGSLQPRVPEKILHGLAIVGGSPSALLAQKILRHKTIKKMFQVVYWLIVAIQSFFLGWYLLFSK